MKILVIHADDLGLSEGVNRGIFSALQQKTVTSTSLLANFPQSLTAIEQARSESVDVGWHLNLTEGAPLSPPEKIPSLVQPDGHFHPLQIFFFRALTRQIRPAEIRTELEAQLIFFREHQLVPSHLDGHEHVHLFPGIAEVVREIVAKQKIPFVRISRESGGPWLPRFPARLFLRLLPGSQPGFWKDSGARSLPFYGLTLGQQAGELNAWEKLLERVTEETGEIMVHPGLTEDRFPGSRQQEHSLLTSPAWKELLKKNGIQTKSFGELL